MRACSVCGIISGKTTRTITAHGDQYELEVETPLALYWWPVTSEGTKIVKGKEIKIKAGQRLPESKSYCRAHWPGSKS